MDSSGLAMANGFKSKAQLHTVMIEDEGGIAEFSMPQEILTHKPSDTAIVHTFKNGDSERRIHCNIELPRDELALLKQLQDLAAQNNSVFLPSISARATRYLTHARGKVAKALSMMEATDEWYHEQFRIPLSEKFLADDLKHGIVYWCGRDAELRPLLVFRANRIPKAWIKAGNSAKVINLVTFCLEYFFHYMSVPGTVESFSVLIDLAGLGATQIPLSTLKEVHKKMGSHYVVRGFKTYIVNMSPFFKGVFALAKTILSERQNQKLCVIANKSELLKDYAAHQIEKDFGGTMKTIYESYPFQMNPGPFTPGYMKGPNKDAIPNVHMAFLPHALCGQLWNPALRREDNIQLPYSQMAARIFENCGLPVPVDTVDGDAPQVCCAELNDSMLSPDVSHGPNIDDTDTLPPVKETLQSSVEHPPKRESSIPSSFPVASPSKSIPVDDEMPHLIDPCKSDFLDDQVAPSCSNCWWFCKPDRQR